MAKVVLYHAECNDGIMAAAIVSYFEKDPTIIYHPVQYRAPLPELPAGLDLILVDFCHDDMGAMLQLIDNCATMVIIDHHNGSMPLIKALIAADVLNKKLTVHFDELESGASLTWKVYSPNPMPKCVQLVRNHDLHHRKTIEDDFFFYGVLTETQSVSFWHSLITDDSKVMALIVAGRFIYNFVLNTVLPQARTKLGYTAIGGFSIPVVNVNRVLQSLVLEELCRVSMVAMAYEDLGNGKRKWSVRSLEATNGAAQRIAQEFGGNGHENAAGFVTDVTWMPPLVENM